MRALLIYHHFGPYHAARWRHLQPVAAAAGIEMLGLQVFAAGGPYRWGAAGALPGVRELGLHSTGDEQLRWRDAPRLLRALTAAAPDVVAINGWGTRDALLAHGWCRARAVARVLVSDSLDPGKNAGLVREPIKRAALRGVGAALVGGAPHRRYVQHLGVPADRIREGCDVVDNAHFAAAGSARGEPGRRLLTVARLSAEKNLLAAAEAFLEFAAARPRNEDWSWTLAGYGPLEAVLQGVAARSDGRIRLSGAVDYAALPAAFAAADLYWQPSVRDSWALAVNEAMAAGLPVLVSNRCGCSEDLVTPDTGWSFDPGRPGALREALAAAAREHWRWPTMGQNAARHVEAWGLDRFSRELLATLRMALA